MMVLTRKLQLDTPYALLNSKSRFVPCSMHGNYYIGWLISPVPTVPDIPAWALDGKHVYRAIDQTCYLIDWKPEELWRIINNSGTHTYYTEEPDLSEMRGMTKTKFVEVVE